MKPRVWMLVVAVAFLGCLVTVVMAQGAARAQGGAEPDRLTPEQQALVTEARELGKQIRIARLELQLAEAKDAPEAQIAEKAEQVYRLRGKLHALIAKHPELRRGAGQRMGRHGWHGERGAGRGGRGGGMGRLGAGPGGGRGLGRGRGGAVESPGPAPGWHRGLRGDRGQGLRLRERLRLHQPDTTTVEPAPAEPAPVPAPVAPAD